MKNDEEMASTQMEHAPVPRWRRRRWLLIGGLALAFLLALGIGAVIGASPSTAQAAALTSGSASSSQTLAVAHGSSNSAQPLVVAQANADSAQTPTAEPGASGGPGAHGQCEMLTVSSVNGNTIVAKTSNGSSVTVHTTASTQYNQAGKAVTASAIKVGARISVMGTHNSDGSITATSIDIG